MTDPVKKSVTVPLAPREAFDLFTQGLDGWWPKDLHAPGNGDRSRLAVDPRPGGRLTETRPDGARTSWGTVTHWEPGRRFGLDWHVGRDAEDATHVEVVFTRTDTGTRVDLTHSNWPALGPHAALQATCRAHWDRALRRCYAGCTALCAAA